MLGIITVPQTGPGVLAVLVVTRSSFLFGVMLRRAEEITNLKEQLPNFKDGHIFFEFSIPRMGKRVDVLLLINLYRLQAAAEEVLDRLLRLNP